MEKSDALNKYGLTDYSDPDEIRSKLDETLHSFKVEVLQKYMVPALLVKKIQLIQDHMLSEYLLLNGEIITGNKINQWSDNPVDRVDFIEQYEKQISHLKLELMHCDSFHQLLQVVQAFIITQEYYMVIFRMLFNEFSEALPEEVNTRELIDTGKLLVALKKGELENKLTWEIELELARIDKIQRLKIS